MKFSRVNKPHHFPPSDEGWSKLCFKITFTPRTMLSWQKHQCIAGSSPSSSSSILFNVHPYITTMVDWAFLKKKLLNYLLFNVPSSTKYQYSGTIYPALFNTLSSQRHKTLPSRPVFPLWTLARSLYQCMACLCECACLHAGRDEKDVKWSVAPAVDLYPWYTTHFSNRIKEVKVVRSNNHWNQIFSQLYYS